MVLLCVKCLCLSVNSEDSLNNIYNIIILNHFKFIPVVLLNITCFNISMGKKCCVVDCRSGYAKRKHSGDDDDQNESIYTPVFVFPSNPELKCRWIKFVNRVDCEETKNSGIVFFILKSSI